MSEQDTREKQARAREGIAGVPRHAGEARLWHWIAESLRIRKARKAAIATIFPIVDQSRRRLGEIPDAVWSDPYIVGFILMLISVVARLEHGSIGAHSLSRVQCGAWKAITSAEGAAATEQLTLLNSIRDRDFELGCQNAVTFCSILFGAHVLPDGGGLPQFDRFLDSPFSQREVVSAAWLQFFDAYIRSKSESLVR